MRWRLQEAELSEAMSALGRSKRQLLAMSLARTTTQPSCVERPSSGYRRGAAYRSASLPPQPQSPAFGPALYGKLVLPPIPVQSLSEFLLSKEEKAVLDSGNAKVIA